MVIETIGFYEAVSKVYSIFETASFSLDFVTVRKNFNRNPESFDSHVKR